MVLERARPAVGPYVFTPADRPTLPGSPYVPEHPGSRRFAYGLIAIVVALAATLGNALVTVNLSNLAGGLSLYQAEVSWLPALYVAFNATANLTLIKARIQFGVLRVTYVLLGGYVVMLGWQLLAPSFGAEMAVRAASGLCASGLTTLTVYNLLQAAPAKLRPLALCVGIGLPQLGTPVARLFPVELLALDHWRGLTLIELAVAGAAFLALHALPLPPNERRKVFERLDLLTIGLLVPAFVLICGVLSLGRILWWTDTPWLGVALIAGLVLLALATLVERGRARPLVYVTWLTSRDMLRFAAIAVMMRLALAEQTYGAVGLLTSGGLTNEQLRGLFAAVLMAMILGITVSAVTLAPARLPFQVMIAALLIALGASLDSHASNLTRPAQLYISQVLIAFGASLFVGPALLYGFGRMITKGPDYLVSLIVLFSLTQNLGGLGGSALLGTVQTLAARGHARQLADHLVAGDPQVAARLASGSAALGGAGLDPASRALQGGAQLAQAVSREASILAFNDTFTFVAALAALTAAYVAYVIVFNSLARGPAKGGGVSS